MGWLEPFLATVFWPYISTEGVESSGIKRLRRLLNLLPKAPTTNYHRDCRSMFLVSACVPFPRHNHLRYFQTVDGGTELIPGNWGITIEYYTLDRQIFEAPIQPLLGAMHDCTPIPSTFLVRSSSLACPAGTSLLFPQWGRTTGL